VINGAIDKENGMGSADIFGEFRGPLLAGHDTHRWIGAELFFSPFGQPGAYTVVATQGVTAGENEASDLGSIH
jgi:hypothetical protein